MKMFVPLFVGLLNPFWFKGHIVPYECIGRLEIEDFCSKNSGKKLTARKFSGK